MGLSLGKFSPGSEEKKDIIEERYKKHYGSTTEKPTLDNFYRAVSETVEEINRKCDNAQVRIPSYETIRHAYERHHATMPLTSEVFQKIMKDILVKDTGFTGFGAKDTLIYIYGVPLAAFLLKKRLFPRTISNDVFIPGVTSVTVFALAKLNKI